MPDVLQSLKSLSAWLLRSCMSQCVFSGGSFGRAAMFSEHVALGLLPVALLCVLCRVHSRWASARLRSLLLQVTIYMPIYMYICILYHSYLCIELRVRICVYLHALLHIGLVVAIQSLCGCMVSGTCHCVCLVCGAWSFGSSCRGGCQLLMHGVIFASCLEMYIYIYRCIYTYVYMHIYGALALWSRIWRMDPKSLLTHGIENLDYEPLGLRIRITNPWV